MKNLVSIFTAIGLTVCCSVMGLSEGSWANSRPVFPHMAGYDPGMQSNATVFAAAPSEYSEYVSESFLDAEISSLGQVFEESSVANSRIVETTAPSIDSSVSSDSSKDIVSFNTTAKVESAPTQYLIPEARIVFSETNPAYQLELMEAPQVFLETQIAEVIEGFAGYSVVDVAPNDTYYGNQWALSAISVEKAWSFGKGAGVTIAVIDTGLDFTHPDILSNIWTNSGEIVGNGIDDDLNGLVDDYRGWDFYNWDNNPTDDHGHGTHVAGIAAATHNNGTGIAGVAPESKIMALKALNFGGGGTVGGVLSSLNAAIRYAAQEGARVINMSLGVPYVYFDDASLAAFQDAINFARSLGTITVVSAGNSASYMSTYPALFEEAITVGALYSPTELAWYSSYGYELDVVAPGTSLLSLKAAGTNLAPSYDAAGKYMSISGTSMAAPMVAGAIALMLSENPLLTFNDIYRRLKFSSGDLGAAGFDPFYGNGIINPFKALSEDYYDDGRIKNRYTPDPDVYGIVRTDYSKYGAITNRYDQAGNRAVLKYYTGTTTMQKISFYNASNQFVYSNEYFSDGVSLYRKTYADGRVFEYDAQGKLVIQTFSNKDKIWYYASGNRSKYFEGATGTTYTYLDENFYGNSIGRKTLMVLKTGLETRYLEYWGNTDLVKKTAQYQRTTLLKTTEYLSDGVTITKQTYKNGDIATYFTSGNVERIQYANGTARTFRNENFYGNAVENKDGRVVSVFTTGKETRYTDYWGDETPDAQDDTDKVKREERYANGKLAYVYVYFKSGNVDRQEVYNAAGVWQRTTEYWDVKPSVRRTIDSVDTNLAATGNVVHSEYNSAGKETKSVMDNGVFKLTTYFSGTGNLYQVSAYAADGSWQSTLEYWNATKAVLHYKAIPDANPAKVGNPVLYTYDNLGRLIEVKYDNGTIKTYAVQSVAQNVGSSGSQPASLQTLNSILEKQDLQVAAQKEALSLSSQGITATGSLVEQTIQELKSV